MRNSQSYKIPRKKINKEGLSNAFKLYKYIFIKILPGNVFK